MGLGFRVKGLSQRAVTQSLALLHGVRGQDHRTTNHRARDQLPGCGSGGPRGCGTHVLSPFMRGPMCEIEGPEKLAYDLGYIAGHI